MCSGADVGLASAGRFAATGFGREGRRPRAEDRDPGQPDEQPEPEADARARAEPSGSRWGQSGAPRAAPSSSGLPFPPSPATLTSARGVAVCGRGREVGLIGRRVDPDCAVLRRSTTLMSLSNSAPPTSPPIRGRPRPRRATRDVPPASGSSVALGGIAGRRR